VSTVIDPVIVDNARAVMLSDYSAARDRFTGLRTLARSVGTVYGEALGLVLERHLEAAQEAYEDALSSAERLIEDQAKRIANLTALTSEPF
jgi:hypothetical protein